ncbi:PepSY1/2 domain-containing protein [Chryseomicrobium palamuruense]|uniref:PepSY1/2 domain-containing protein n=1 Tax=Chryseomicrobium palamuruense TaxID=682973 RepID=A0ABV8UVP0_9BACL
MNLKWGVALTAALVLLGSFYLWQQSRYEAMASTVSTNYASKVYNIGESMEQLGEHVDGALLPAKADLAQDDLEGIWRMTDKIRNEMSTLPFEEDASVYWLNYLARIGDAAKLTSDGELDFSTWKDAMRKSRENLQVVTSEWMRSNGSVEKKEELLSRFYHQQASEKSLEEMRKLNELVKSYTETDFPASTSEADYAKKKAMANLDGETLSENEVVEKWKTDFPEFKNATIRITESKKNAPYPFYHIEFSGDKKKGFADYSKVGGHLLTTLIEQPFTEKSKDPAELQQLAKEKMTHLGYEDTVMTSSRENHVAWHFTFTRQVPNQAVVYSDSIQLKLAKDTGEILGLQPIEYIQKENLPDTVPLEIDSKNILDDHVTLESSRLAYIEDSKMNQVLCYEWVIRTETGTQYRMYVDAKDGKIIKKEKIKG